MIRKITLGLAVLLTGFSANALATSSEKTPFNVTVPCYNGGFTFGLAGLYTKPSNDALDYAIVYPISENLDAIGDLFNDGRVQNVSPDYDWGYNVSLGFIFPGTANDINATYTSFNRHTRDNLNPVGSLVMGTVSPFIVAASEDGAIIGGTRANVNFNYQALDVDFGQHYNIGCNSHVRLLAGVRFADIDRVFHVDYDATAVEDGADTSSLTVNTRQKSEFKGVGPRFGTDVHYNLGNGFGVVGQATGAVLIGNIYNNYSEVDTEVSGDDVITASASFRNPKHTKVVANLTGKLGLDYNYEFCNPTHTKLTFEAGYQVDHYLNAVNSTTAFSALDGAKQITDVSFNGPYLGVKFKV